MHRDRRSTNYLNVQAAAHMPTPEQKQMLLERHAELLADRKQVYWRLFQMASEGHPPLISLQFTGSITMDRLWCSYFRAKLTASDGTWWIARSHLFSARTGEVILIPTPEDMALGKAHGWEQRAETAPLISAKVSFRGCGPERHIAFRSLH